MREDTIKVVGKDGEVLTLQEFYEAERRTHLEQARLPFEEKIRILVTLQKLALEWGEKKDVIVWQVVSPK
jgi:hypothetical protein